MKLKIKTEKLKEMVSKAVKGAGMNKLIPLTQMMAVKLEKGTLSIVTTDMTNYLYIKENKVEGEDFYAVVEVDTFSKLISKMTSENISMKLHEAVLQVIGNGKYSVPLQFDDDGEMVQYPDPLKDFKAKGKAKDIKQSTIQTILTSIKPALAETMENPCYTGYYLGDSVVGTDTSIINFYKSKLIDKERLVSNEVMNLLGVMDAEKIKFESNEDMVVFSTPDVVVYGRDLEGIEDFAVKQIFAYLDKDFKSMCKVSRQALLQVLDRLALFVSDYDKGGIYITFTKEGLQISSKESTGVEVIEYAASENFQDFTGCIDINYLQKQVKAQVGEAVEIWYGLENIIKMVDGDVVQIIALMEDDRMEE